MNAKKFRSISRWMLVCLLALLLLGQGFSLGFQAQAASAQWASLTAEQDAYTDVNADTTNFDAGLLTAANSPGPLDQGDVTTKQIFLQFDLSAVEFEIKSATLSLGTLTCGGAVPVDAVALAIYGVNNTASWDETTLTWANQPAISTEALATLDAGSTTFNRARTYTWTDSAQGAFSNWLETQRSANNQSATLVVVIDNADNPGLADIFFEDREGTGAAYGCPDSLGGPMLEVRASGTYSLFLPLVKR